MHRHILCAIFLIPIALAFIACDEETTAPPIDEPTAQLLEGVWTLRVSPDPELYDPFLIPGTFSTVEDTVIFDTSQGTFRGDMAGRGVNGLDIYWEGDTWSWLMTLSVDVARDGETLTGTFETAMKGGNPITGTVFGAPGDEIPEIAVRLTPAHISIPLEASLNMLSHVSGYHDRSVTWNQEPAGVGTLSSSGRYTAPQNAPEPTEVMIVATSMVDIGARGTATVVIEVPPVDPGDPVEPVCQYVQGYWSVAMIPFSQDGSRGYPARTTWNFYQDGCDLVLNDRGTLVALEITGPYAHGICQTAPMTQYTYDLYFHDGMVIVEPSTIEILNMLEPSEPELLSIRGNRWVLPK